jgi:hypothetical protein
MPERALVLSLFLKAGLNLPQFMLVQCVLGLWGLLAPIDLTAQRFGSGEVSPLPMPACCWVLWSSSSRP